MKLINTITTKVVALDDDKFIWLLSQIKEGPYGLSLCLTEDAEKFFYKVGVELKFIKGPARARKGFHVSFSHGSVIEIAEHRSDTDNIREIQFQYKYGV